MPYPVTDPVVNPVKDHVMDPMMDPVMDLVINPVAGPVKVHVLGPVTGPVMVPGTGPVMVPVSQETWMILPSDNKESVLQDHQRENSLDKLTFRLTPQKQPCFNKEHQLYIH